MSVSGHHSCSTPNSCQFVFMLDKELTSEPPSDEHPQSSRLQVPPRRPQRIDEGDFDDPEYVRQYLRVIDESEALYIGERVLARRRRQGQLTQPDIAVDPVVDDASDIEYMDAPAGVFAFISVILF